MSTSAPALERVVALSDRTRPATWLVVGGCLVAPLDLVLVRSLSVYDVLVGLAFLHLWRVGRLEMPRRAYLAAAYAFLAAATLSAFRATYAVEALTQVLQYAFIFFVLVPVVLTVVQTRRRAVVSVALLCLGTLLAVLHSFVFRPTQGAGRVVVFFSDNPNRLGYPAAYMLPLLLVLWHLSRRQRRRTRLLVAVGCLIGLYLSIWAVFASGSRSSLLGTAIALAVFVAARPGVGILRRAGRTALLLVVAGVLGWALLSAGQLPDTLEERVTRSLQGTADPEDQANLVGDRKHLADAGVLGFVDSPFVGTGLDNFRHVTTDYNLFATPQVPHNLWLQLLVQVGLVGTVAFAAYLLLAFRDIRRAYRLVPEEDRQLLWGVVASVAGILTIFMFAPEMLDRHYWLIIALGLAVTRGAVPEPFPSPSPSPSQASLP